MTQVTNRSYSLLSPYINFIWHIIHENILYGLAIFKISKSLNKNFIFAASIGLGKGITIFPHPVFL